MSPTLIRAGLCKPRKSEFVKTSRRIKLNLTPTLLKFRIKPVFINIFIENPVKVLSIEHLQVIYSHSQSS